jgi:hypothetical protein
VQQLHLVGTSPDHVGLVLSARKGATTGAFVVKVDERLRAAVIELLGELEPPADNEPEVPAPPIAEVTTAQALPVNTQPARDTTMVTSAARPQSALTPREIQARLRSGYTITEVAEEAGVAPEWVERFAVPILAEQTQVLERALGFVYVAPKRGKSTLPLGEAVGFNAEEKGVSLPDDVYERAWSAYQLRDATWVVRFSYVSRRRLYHADWEVDLRAGRLEALNRPAAELGHVARGRRRQRVQAGWDVGVPEDEGVALDVIAVPATSPDAVVPEPAPTVVVRRVPQRRTPAPAPAREAAAAVRRSAATKRVVAKKAAPAKKAAVRKAAVKKAAPAKKRAAAKKAAPRKAPAKKAAPKRVAAKKAPAKKTAPRKQTPAKKAGRGR